MAAIILLDTGGSLSPLSKIVRLTRANLPATLIQEGLTASEIIKLETSIDNGTSFFQAEDSDGVVQFAASGKNIIPINNPMIFRLSRSGGVDVAIATVSSGTAIPGGGNYARFNFTPGPTLVVGQFVSVFLFVTNLNYNVSKGVVTVTSSGTLEINVAKTGDPVVFGTSETVGKFALVSTATFSFGTDV